MQQRSFCFRVLHMPYNELRKDYLLDRWVVIATERSRRPTDLTKPKPQTANNAGLPHVRWKRKLDTARRNVIP